MDDCQLNYITKFNRKTLLESGTLDPLQRLFLFVFVGCEISPNEKNKNKKGIFCHNRVILKVRRSGGETASFGIIGHQT